MKLALISRVGSAQELVDAHVDFHHAAGVDVVRLVEGNPGPEELAGLAEETGADWVIESGANEFWWPRGGSLRQLLEPVSQSYGAVQALTREFVPVTAATQSFSDRMTHRLAHGGERRLVRRASSSERLLRGWFPFEVLRFPADGETAAFDADALRRGVDDGLLIVDTRVRDALRALAEGRSPGFGRPDLVDDARFAADLADLGRADVADAAVRLDELEARLAALESSLTEIVKRKLRKLRRR
jgi:hypothetical protein